MKRVITLTLMLWGIAATAQIKDSLIMEEDSIYVLKSAEIIQRLPLTSEKFTKKELEQKNLGQDLPSLLGEGISVVSTSDAGAGIGYSSLRIRGISQEQINITVNGIPLNDPESQSVFWVNMPDLASDVRSINIQRGVGTTSSGSGAFGAQIGVDTSHPSHKAFLETSDAWGSFNTQKYTLKGGTGLLWEDRISLDLSASKIKSDGYIDRASSNLESLTANLLFKAGLNTHFKYWGFFGKEKTYQAWNGIDGETMKKDRRFNSSGAIYNEDWTEIIGYYKNETDNYKQNHHHLSWVQRYKDGWKSDMTLYYVRGKGYYESYKQDAKTAGYKLDTPDGRSDLVRQKWLDNHSYGVNFNMENQRLGDWKVFGGMAYNHFDNDHYGKVIWLEALENPDIDWEYYRNKSKKDDFSIYAKALLNLENLELFGDLQFRTVDYKGLPVPGGDSDAEDFHPFHGKFNFLNPKVGMNYYLPSNSNLYFFYGMAHREPTRTDYLGNVNAPKAETLHDFEAGWKKPGRLNLTANLFYMYYIDQLVATGELSPTGRYIRTNSGKSHRAGIEMAAGYSLLPERLKISGNLSWSSNRNHDFSEVGYDEEGEEILIKYGNTPISFSPDWVGAFSVEYKPWKPLTVTLSNKYVGKQYLSNTQPKDGRLDDYFLSDLLLNWHPDFNWFGDLEFSFMINNLFNKKYASNGFYYGEAFYYPQAGTHVLGGVKLRF